MNVPACFHFFDKFQESSKVIIFLVISLPPDLPHHHKLDLDLSLHLPSCVTIGCYSHLAAVDLTDHQHLILTQD